jgi:hypothetical protein
MPPRFPEGSAAYDKDGRSYTVEEVDGGMVYCTASNGVETEFPENSLMNEAEWAVRSDGRRDDAYVRIKGSRAYLAPTGNVSKPAAASVLKRADNLYPGILDFIAFTAAERMLTESHDTGLIAGLSIIKCREIFDGARPEVRNAVMAGVLGTSPDTLASAAEVGDNLLRAMIDKGINAGSFDEFQDRPRK